MKILISNPLSKLWALGRFVILKTIYCKRLNISKMSYFGKSLRLFIFKNSRITVNGKIHISDHVEIQSRGSITFGHACAVNSFSRIIAFGDMKIGDRVLIAQHVSILDHDHAYERVNGNLEISGFDIKPITIGNQVWIADKVTITKGVSIGDNVIIGANSVVTKDIPSNSIAGGVPARVIKSLDEAN